MNKNLISITKPVNQKHQNLNICSTGSNNNKPVQLKDWYLLFKLVNDYLVKESDEYYSYYITLDEDYKPTNRKKCNYLIVIIDNDF